MTEATLAEVKEHLPEFIEKAGEEEIVIIINGRPAAVIIGFEDESDWLEYQLLKDEDFKSRIAESREQYNQGHYKTLEEVSQNLAD
ncbi:MAG: type II toxin-antitoxin system Phd/YefM family antitoxin [Blastocatellia bacterium]